MPGKKKEKLKGSAWFANLAAQAKLRRWLPNLMIILGVLALPFIVWRVIATEEKFNSPFDQIDADRQNRQGFLPMLNVQPGQTFATQSNTHDPLATEIAPELSLEDLAAPTLEGFPSEPDAELPDLEANPGLIPEHLLIPAIDLFVPVVTAEYRLITFQDQTYQQWEAPRGYVAGWETDSAGLGVPGNTVLYGHHNIAGKVFENLYQVEVGQVIQLKSGDQLFSYRVVLSMILEEKYQPLAVRLDNARWILPSTDERITLITCWPETGNSHRVVVVAVREGPVAQIPVTGGQYFFYSEPDPTAIAALTMETGSPGPTNFAPPVAERLFEASYPDDAVAPDLNANPGLVPERVLIPAVGIFVPVWPVENSYVENEGVEMLHWEPPHAVGAGWEMHSAGLGVTGNTVIYGFQDVYGAPFKELHKVLVGHIIQLKSGEEIFSYRVIYTAIIEERCQDLLVGSVNARWLLPSMDERVTLLTCYPETGYTHRVMVVAVPVELEE